MPTVQFQQALQALRDRDEQFLRRWESPVAVECYDGLENEAYMAAYLSNLIRRGHASDDLLVNLMRDQENRLRDRIREALECGLDDYASSRSFHNHVKLTIDAVLRPVNYAGNMKELYRDDYAYAYISICIRSLGIDRPKSGWQAVREAGHAASRQRHAERGRDEEDGLGCER